MPLAQDDYVVQALAADRSDQPLSKAVLPGRGWRNRPVTDAHSGQSTSNEGAEDLISISDQKLRDLIPRESLG